MLAFIDGMGMGMGCIALRYGHLGQVAMADYVRF